jgi:hypothetical protein
LLDYEEFVSYYNQCVDTAKQRKKAAKTEQASGKTASTDEKPASDAKADGPS